MRRNILITGGSSGLGAGMAWLFAAQGHDLALAARRVDRLRELAAELEHAHPTVRVATYQLDVNDHDQVFAVVERAADDLGGIDRVIVNAGIGKGGRIGTGRFAENAETARTDFVAALAQCEAAMQHFYERGRGHLVVMSSMSAVRGMPGAMATYGAAKAGLAHLAEGIRLDLLGRSGHDIAVSTIYPGYIATELNEGMRAPFKVDTETGCRAIVQQIDKEAAEAPVPPWPWRPLGFVLRRAPLRVLRRMV